MAEWSVCRTRNPAVPGSSLALTTTWICFSVFRKINYSNPRPRLYIASWFASFGILNNVMFSLNYSFQLFARPH